MPGRDTAYQKMAKEAAERVRQGRDLAEQLTLLPDEMPAAPIEAGDSADARTRGPGKALNQMREFMASKGYRMPEEVILQLAGLDSGLEVWDLAMRRTEQQLTWAYAGTKDANGKQVQPTGAQRMAALQQNVAVILRSNDALMPYGTPKATPDGPQTTVVPVMMPQPPAAGPDQARDVTPAPSVINSRLMPRNLIQENEQKQQVKNSGSDVSDGGIRTE